MKLVHTNPTMKILLKIWNWLIYRKPDYYGWTYSGKRFGCYNGIAYRNWYIKFLGK